MSSEVLMTLWRTSKKGELLSNSLTIIATSTVDLANYSTQTHFKVAT